MQITLFTLDGGLFLLRWMHIFFGVIWIGHLYYFNFVQGAFFNETDAATKSNAVQKLVPRALWWFRWGAFWTLLTGLAILSIRGHQIGLDGWASSYGINILTGAVMGLLMAANVWFIIWPAQKVVIQSALQSAAGGQPLAEAAARGARAMVASRTNTLLSIPMLFFMAAARHLPYNVNDESNIIAYALGVGGLLLLIQANAMIGKTGPMTTIRGVVTSGFALTAVVYAWIVLTI